ncbi:MAG: hypothetical protein ACYTHJ_07500 [Planctomycetota bacterium]|jgi:hypothetical protein
MNPRTGRPIRLRALAAAMLLPTLILPLPLKAKQNIRDAFFAVYPGGVGTPIETVPSIANHCGVCHYDFTGGGPRNPYGDALAVALDGFPNNATGREQAVLSIELLDSDSDGFDTFTEVTDTITYANTPTFPGLTPANVGSTFNVDLADIQDYLVPSTGGDTTPPTVNVTSPNGGEILLGNEMTLVEWTASDASGIAAIDIHFSDDGGVTYRNIALGVGNSGSYAWFPPNRPSDVCLVRVTATDNAFNAASDTSDAFFNIESPPGGLVGTTLRDFDQPGSQPFEAGTITDAAECGTCHGNYDPAVAPYFNWSGNMMAQASRDIIFEASMAIANQDAPDSGDLCLRCHLPAGWLGGRSVPTDGSQMEPLDFQGVSCDFCHRLVDLIYEEGVSPEVDEDILSDLALPPTEFANGMYVIDPTGTRRGPFVDATSGHDILVSPFHQEAAICGTCHDVSNPAFENDGSGNFVPNNFDEPADDFSSNTLLAIERTYSEWFHSEYNTPGGVFAPEFGGNLDFVGSCQDCHMRDVTGRGCIFPSAPIRDDLPLHDMTGGSTWLPGLLGQLYPGEVDETALAAGIERARYMLQNAASLAVQQVGSELEVTVTNETGHKLPTGYPEGRRIWINVKFFDGAASLLSESGAYDPDTGILTEDAEITVYESKPGLDSLTAPIVGVPEGPSFHFVLNNKVFKDNRIPPRGFTNAAFAAFGGAPVGTSYVDGQFWHTALYAIPIGAQSAEVTLYYQSTTKEFVEFLLAENTTNSKGQELYDLWNDNGKCPPEVMRFDTTALVGVCGNSFCDDDEDACSCPEDCGDPPPSETGACADQEDNDCDTLTDCDDDDCLGEPGCPECFTDDHCDDDAYCNGSETCVAGVCQTGTDPCPGQMCDETGDACVDCLVDSDCDDDAYCNGSETCVAGVCQTGTDPCPGQMCDEAGDACVDCLVDSDCDDDTYCNGSETCVAGVCLAGSDPCPGQMCDEAGDACVDCFVDSDCDDDTYCNGSESCASGVCQTGSDPCPGQLCDEAGDACVDCLDDDDCDDQDVCTDDSCIAGVCDYLNNTAPCDDIDICTENDTCANGTCSGTPIPDCGICVDAGDCDDENPCTDDTCPAGNCVYTANTAPCDDGNTCTTNDACAGGTCQGGPALDCDDQNACTLDTCDAQTGCENVDETPAGMCCAPTGGDLTPIDDGLDCTDDVCNPDGTVDHIDTCPKGTVCDDALNVCFETVTASANGTGLYQLAVEMAGGGDQPYAVLVTGDAQDATVACVSAYAQPDGSLAAEPAWHTVAEWGAVMHIEGPEIIPGAEYLIEVQGHLPPSPFPAWTWPWGDVNGNQTANFEDIQFVVLGFQGHLPVPFEHMDIEPCGGNEVINFADILWDVQAFQGSTYEQTGCPIPCPGVAMN